MHETAVRADSGGCLIADAIKAQYPQFSSVVVDMATIRITDREAGLRYCYLTPEPAQQVLLWFDQGWPQRTTKLTIRRAVKVTAVTSGGLSKVTQRAEQRKAKLETLETKLRDGDELTQAEKATLTKLTKPAKPKIERPHSPGPVTDIIEISANDATVVGGKPLPRKKKHPNLLASRKRVFGAKMSEPGVAFQEALELGIAAAMKQE
jgi:hypothetical protein